MSNPSAFELGKAFADSLAHTYSTFTFTTALQEALSSSGWEVSNHSFTTTAAAAAGGLQQQQQQQQQQLECVNVHAVLHSPRADGKEALVLVTPVNHQHFSTGEAPRASARAGGGGLQQFHHLVLLASARLTPPPPSEPSKVVLSLALAYALLAC